MELIFQGTKAKISYSKSINQKPKILILDESTSSLDYKMNMRLINFKNNGATKITTSHNINTLKNMDKVFCCLKEKLYYLENIMKLK